MKKGSYFHSTEIRQKMSGIRKKKFKDGALVTWNKGKKNCFSEETLKKLRVAQTGKHHSEEAKRKMSEQRKGRIPWNKGKVDCYSEETLKKMSERRIGLQSGKQHPMWGKHPSEETRRKIKENHRHTWRGRHHTQESIEKCRLAKLGTHHTEESKKKISEHNARWMLGKKPWNTSKKGCFSEEVIQKMSKMRLGKPLSEITKAKMRKPKSEVTKKKFREANLGKHHSDETKQKLRDANLGQKNPNFGKPKSSETKLKMRESALKRSPESFRKSLVRRTPSSLETKFQGIIDSLNLPYMFVGDGGFIIERKCPDFICTNHDKIAIEVYNRSHKNKFRRGGLDGWKNERIEIFGRYGWRIEFFDETQVNEAEVLRRLG